MRVPILVTFLIGLVAEGGYAQNVLEVELLGQPLVYTDQGAINGCGLRVVATEPPALNARTFRSIDVSLNVYRRGVALGKLIAQDVKIDSNGKPQPVRVASYGNWWRTGKTVASPVEGTFKESTEKGAYLYQTTISASADLFMAAAKQERVMIGVKWRPDTERIYAGVVRLEPTEAQQLVQCFVDVFEDVKPKTPSK